VYKDHGVPQQNSNPSVIYPSFTQLLANIHQGGSRLVRTERVLTLTLSRNLSRRAVPRARVSKLKLNWWLTRANQLTTPSLCSAPISSRCHK